jgi:glycerol-3-phosphate dehydrogenase subunit B
MRRGQHYDVVVIGAGTAGLVAATRLAQSGANVCVVAKGVGSTHLAPGTIDVLGYAPERVESPAQALPEFVAAHPDHPYALVGEQVIAESIDWLVTIAKDGPLPGYVYTGNLERNLMLPTAVGALKPSAVVPETFAAGDGHHLGRVAVVGLAALRDFHPKLCAANLAAAGIDARGLNVEVEFDRVDASTLGLARLFDDRAWRTHFSGRLAPLLGAAEHVALPAMLGLSDAHAVLADLAERLGRPVFEIATLPPSVPGMRLFEILRHAARAAGARIAFGAGVIGHTRDGDRIVSLDTDTAGSQTTYAADAFVLASGGFHSGAIALDSQWQTHEQVFDLPLQGVPDADQPRFVAPYFAEQPLARAGVSVDSDLRARGAANVVVAGASLPGAVSWREASGEGVALASGYRAAQVLAAELGARMQTQTATASQ